MSGVLRKRKWAQHFQLTQQSCEANQAQALLPPVHSNEATSCIAHKEAPSMTVLDSTRLTQSLAFNNNQVMGSKRQRIG